MTSFERNNASHATIVFISYVPFLSTRQQFFIGISDDFEFADRCDQFWTYLLGGMFSFRVQLPRFLMLHSVFAFHGRAILAQGTCLNMARTIRFGKHEGRTFEDVRASEPQYVEFCYRQAKPSPAMKEFIDWMNANPARGPERHVRRAARRSGATPSRRAAGRPSAAPR